MSDIIRKYTPEETKRRRDQYIDAHAIPTVARVFAALPKVQSAVLLVGQYWADEAYDAVHGHLLYSVAREPDLNALARETTEISRLLDAKKIDFDEADLRTEWYSTFVEGPAAAKILGMDRDSLFDFHETAWLPEWDSNGEAISLFAAFCPEGSNQEMPVAEACVPYAHFGRGSDGGVAVRVVGKNIRPWLDGVRPEHDPDEVPPSDNGGQARTGASLSQIVQALLRTVFGKRR